MSARNVIALLLIVIPLAARGQELADLADKKDFRAMRSASTDPAQNDGDFRAIQPGQSLTIADISGAGRIEHIWFTISGDTDHLRELVLRITWDDAKRPAVECPIGDFFAQGPGKYVEFSSAAVSIGSNLALNCYWPMPFAKHAVMTVTNEGANPVGSLYYNIDYRLEKSPERNMRYFHTQYRNFFPAPKGKPVTICDTKGSGHFVGTIVTVLANSDGWWGEGNDLWYIDGDTKPTIEGTGSEDYFCGAFDFGRAFSRPYFGVPYYDNGDHGGEKAGIQNTCYRWHIPDPVPFQKSLVFNLEHGSLGGNEDRQPFTNSYTTVGLFYLDNPEGDGPPLAPYEQRVPKLLKG